MEKVGSACGNGEGVVCMTTDHALLFVEKKVVCKVNITKVKFRNKSTSLGKSKTYFIRLKHHKFYESEKEKNNNACLC